MFASVQICRKFNVIVLVWIKKNTSVKCAQLSSERSQNCNEFCTRFYRIKLIAKINQVNLAQGAQSRHALLKSLRYMGSVAVFLLLFSV